jgi:hypothetical protein
VIGPAGFGVIAIDASGLSVTVSVVTAVGVLDEYNAMIVVVPLVGPVVTRPVLLIVAIVLSDTLQLNVGDDVKFCVIVVVLPDAMSANVAVAVNWCRVFLAMNGAFGAMVMEIGSTTVSMAVPEMLLTSSVAVIMNVPVASEVARPKVPRVLPMVTAVASEVLQVAADVQLISVPFEKIAMAMNSCLVPVAMVGLAGATLIDVSFPPREQLMKPIAVAKSATATILPCLRIFILLFSPGIP